MLDEWLTFNRTSGFKKKPGKSLKIWFIYLLLINEFSIGLAMIFAHVSPCFIRCPLLSCKCHYLCEPICDCIHWLTVKDKVHKVAVFCFFRVFATIFLSSYFLWRVWVSPPHFDATISEDLYQQTLSHCQWSWFWESC